MEAPKGEFGYPLTQEQVDDLYRESDELRVALAKNAAEVMLARIRVADETGNWSAQDKAREYIASDGSLWHTRYDPQPIRTREYDWTAWHDDYDGAPDGGDNRLADGESLEACIHAIEVYLHENPEERASAGE